MSSKYAIALYELVQLRADMDRCIQQFALDRFRDLLGVPSGAYERGNDFIKRMIEPTVLEVNGLSEFSVKLEVERAYSRAPITGVSLCWLAQGDERIPGDLSRTAALETGANGAAARDRVTGAMVLMQASLPVTSQRVTTSSTRRK